MHPTEARRPVVQAPTGVVLSTMLTEGDHAAGIFLDKLMTHTPKDGWCIIDRPLWMQACCFTSNQLEEVVAKLDATGLVEVWKYSSGRSELMLLAPAQKTTSYLTSATT